MATGVTDLPSLEECFVLFSKFGDAKSNGKSITLTNIDKWMKQANIIGKKITTVDTGICFNKFKTKQMDIKIFKEFITRLAESKKMDSNELIQKLIACGIPGTTGVTKTIQTGGVDRLTNTTKYTGTHKERFDESGKGKGIDGRTDKTDNTGFVSGYKNKDTYDKKK